MKAQLKIIFIGLIFLNVSCQNSSLNNFESGSFKDTRDGKIYKTIKIGNQIWMAENLAYSPSIGEYRAYENNEKYVSEFGYLYNWQTACNVCPSGWHLPEKNEWTELIKTTVLITKKKDYGKVLKSSEGWLNRGNGYNLVGFNALPSGRGYGKITNEVFSDLGKCGYWWFSGEDRDGVWQGNLESESDYLEYGLTNKSNFYSVRCLKDSIN